MTDTVPTSRPTDLRQAFRAVHQTEVAADKRSSPRITLRLTEDEHIRLIRLAEGVSVSAYVREALFGNATAPRKRHSRVPLKDEGALAQVLGALGQSHMASNLNQLARHANCGTLTLDEGIENELKIACAQIAWIRVKLIEALGLQAGDEP